MKYFVFLFVLFANILVAQSKQQAVSPLEIKWKLVSNAYQNSENALEEFTIINRSNQLLNNDWTVYFNYGRSCVNIDSNSIVSLHHINGDLYRLAPAKNYKTLEPGDSIKILFLCEGAILNVSALPTGLYFGWNNVPKSWVSMLLYNPLPIEDEDAVSDSEIFKRNKSIAAIPFDKLTKILPTPMSYRETKDSFILSNNFQIAGDSFFSNEKEYLKKPLLQYFKNFEPSARNKIIFLKAPMLNEAYKLSVKKNVIEITASSTAGAFYGVQSLIDYLSAYSVNHYQAKIPGVEIEDRPRFSYRSLSLDVARNFIPKSELMKIINAMAMYKLNVLHLHFSDDEGWRIEIPSLPELTEVAAYRGAEFANQSMLPPAFGSGPDARISRGSGYYTRNDFINILKYATLRHIKIIPEIESPGHSRAAIVAMKYRYDRLMKENKITEAKKYLLTDLNDSSVYKSAQLWKDNVMCVAMPSVYTFLETVTNDLLKMYKAAGAPLETIHMGGDEVPAGAWEHSPICRALILNSNSVHSTNDLWQYYYEKVSKILAARGLYISGWEEMGMHKVVENDNPIMKVNPFFTSKNFHLHVWNNMIGWGNEDLPYRLANAGYKVVLSPVSNNYFDLAYYRHPQEPGLYWGGFVDIDKPFKFIPYDYYKNSTEDVAGNKISPSYFDNKERLTENGRKNIVGIEALLWGETLFSDERVEYMLLPKLLGFAERAWAPTPSWAKESNEAKSLNMYQQAYSAFLNNLGKIQLPVLDNGFLYRIPTAGAVVSNHVVSLNVQMPGLMIRYTTNGIEPTKTDKLYTMPIKERKIIKAKIFSSNGRSGRTIIINNSK